MPENDDYFELLVETFILAHTSGHRGRIHVRPVAGHGVDTNLLVECSRDLTDKFPVGTRFALRAKYARRLGGPLFIKAPYAFAYRVVES